MLITSKDYLKREKFTNIVAAAALPAAGGGFFEARGL